MDGRLGSNEIERAAAEWVARMDRAPLTGAEQTRLQAWLDGDVRCQGALLRAKAVWMQAEALRGAGQLHALNPAAKANTPVATVRRGGRRIGQQLLRWPTAAAASLLLVVLLFVSFPAPVAYATSKGEMRRVPLAGGSALTLNTDSRIEVYERGGRTRIKLTRGEVLVEAAHNGAPLELEVDGRRLDAAAATFVVRKFAQAPAQVTVQAGAVTLPGSTTRLPANSRLLLDAPAASTPVVLTPMELQRELAWRDGKLDFRGETLAEAAADFARYSDIRIVITDPALAREPITGLFAANNPVGFGQAVSRVFDARMHQEKNRVVLGSAD